MPKVHDKKVNKKTGKPLNKYRLLAGAHEQADPEWQPTEQEFEEAKARGTVPRAPVKRYSVGQTVYSDKDLVHLFGHNKFQLIGNPVEDKGNLGEGVMGDPTPLNLEAGYVHPHGQVNTGFQHTGAKDAFGNTVSGSISQEELEERGLAAPPPADKSEKLKKQREEARGNLQEESSDDSSEDEEKPVQPKKTVKASSGEHSSSKHKESSKADKSK